MYVVTGGAGFLGSNIIAEMEACGLGPIIVCDEMRDDGRWRNLAKHTVERFLSPDQIGVFLQKRGAWIKGVVHMGAISSTAETDVGKLVSSNVEPFRWIWNACSKHQVPLIYASSAAVYGLDTACVDDDSPRALRALRPTNAYGWSKKTCDENAVAWATLQPTPWRPPFWAGLRFFNVYGPNENHKFGQRSYVTKAMDACLSGEPLKLFVGDYARDWVYVVDIARLVAAWLGRIASPELLSPPPSGIYNVGSGQSVSFSDVVQLVAKTLDRPIEIAADTMPESMRAGYQPRTKANLTKLRSAWPDFRPSSLNDGIGHYAFSFVGLGLDSYR